MTDAMAVGISLKREFPRSLTEVLIMTGTLKPLNQQTMVITGASSGIGLATALAAAEAGAKLVLAARSHDTLSEIATGINGRQNEAIAVPCDVGKRSEVERVVQAALDRFGRIDTWINNAGVSIYGRIEEVSEEDSRQLFETNFWGVYHGSVAALPHLKASRGALINVGSEVSEAVIPLQGMYSASKHAVKGFTDALRIEVELIERAPVSITLIQPTAVDTPYPQHAKNYMTREPKLPQPRIDPEQVARAILDAATNPTRSRKVGAMASINTAVAKMIPSLADRISAKQADRQHYEEQPRNPEGTLYRASHTGQVHGSGGREQ